MGRLRDRVVLVTGAAGAVGSAVAAAIREAGGVAATADLRGADHVLDVTREADWRAVLDRVAAEHGRLDGLVHAAGAGVPGTLEQTPLADWRRAVDGTVLGAFLGIRTAWALLGVAGGSVVTVSVVAPRDGAADEAVRSAIRQLTRAAALDGARQPARIRVNAVQAVVAGGPVGATPLGRLPRPEEIAACVVHLLSDDSAFVTGASYVLDGGSTAG